MGSTASYETSFRERVERARDVASFMFDLPQGYSFLPGQYFTLTLDTREGEQSKHFSHCEAPSDRWLELTTRMTGSAFKDALSRLRAGDRVHVAGPEGRLTLPEGTRRVAFLVGGVGVTPARCIVRDAVQRDTGLEAYVFYGNQDQGSVAFADELDGYDAARTGIRVVHVLAEPSPGWEGETGFIDAGIVRRHLDPADGWRWMVSGPPPMVEAMRRVLVELGVPADRTSIESFAGYG